MPSPAGGIGTLGGPETPVLYLKTKHLAVRSLPSVLFNRVTQQNTKSVTHSVAVTATVANQDILTRISIDVNDLN